VTTVEAQNKFITNFETTNKHDTYALSTAGRKARIALGLEREEKLTQIADKGFDTGYELKQCTQHNIDTLVAPKKRVSPSKNPAYNKSKFIYDKAADNYTCPASKILQTNGNYYKRKKGVVRRKSYSVKRYTISFHTCNACPYKMECAGESSISKSKGRYLERSEYQDYVDKNIERVKNNKELYKTRQSIVEHPYGTIKRQWGYDYTLLKGKEKVAGEFAIIFTIYNMRRAISILGVNELINLLRRAKTLFLGPKSSHIKRFKYLLYFYNLVHMPKYKSINDPYHLKLAFMGNR
jgi:hypothetical protein